MGRRWSKDEEEVLVSNYQALDSEAIAMLLPQRTGEAVRQRLFRMNLHREHWAHFSLRECKLPLPNAETAAYLAGHFDGEGCVRLRKKGKAFGPEVSVIGAYMPTIEEYAYYFGGAIIERKGTNKPLWQWRTFSYYEVNRFIDLLKPFAREKLEQMMVLQHYITCRVKFPATHAGEEIRRLGEECSHKLTQLKKGKSA